MADYIKQLQQQREKEEQQKKKEKRQEVIGGVVGIAAFVGVGIAAYKSGVLHKPVLKAGSKIADSTETARVALSATKKTIKEEGLGKFLRQESKDTLKKNLETSLTSHYLNREIGVDKVPTKLEQEVFRLRSVKKKIAEKYDTEVRLNALIDHLRENKFADEKAMDQIEKAMRTDRSWRKRRELKEEELRKYLEKHKLDIDGNKGEGFNVLLSQINVYSRKDYSDIGIDSDAVQKHLDKLYENVEESLVESFKKRETFLSKVLGSKSEYHQMTVEEALERDDVFMLNKRFREPVKGKTVGGTTFYEDTMQYVDVKQDIERLAQKYPELLKQKVDKGLYTDGSELIDLRGVIRSSKESVDYLADNFKLPFIGINPIRMAQTLFTESIDDLPEMAVLQAGSKQAILTDSLSQLAEDVVVSGSKAFSIATGELIKDNIDLVPTYGMHGRAIRTITGHGVKESSDNPVVAFFQELLDIGRSEDESQITRKAKDFFKFKDENWIRNQYEEYLESGVEFTSDEEGRQKITDEIVDFFNKAYKLFDDNVEELTESELKELEPLIKKHLPYLFDESGESIVDLSMDTQEDVVNVLTKIVSHNTTKESGPDSATYRNLQKYLWEYEQDPQAFLDRKVSARKIEQLIPGVDQETYSLSPYTDKVKRAIHQEIISTIFQREGAHKFESLSFSESTEAKIKDLLLLDTLVTRENLLRTAQTDDHKEIFAKNFIGWAQSATKEDKSWGEVLSEHFGQRVYDYTPFFSSVDAGTRGTNVFGPGTQYLAINRSVNPLKAINEVLKQGGSTSEALGAFLETTVGQLGFGPSSIRAGRDNLGKITTTTTSAYNVFSRINQGFARGGLGLSADSMGSLQDVYKNIVLKRMIYPAMMVLGLRYVDYNIGEITGKKPSHAALDTYAVMRQDVAWLKDKTGITSFRQALQDQFPGIEYLTEDSPIGEILNIATFGFLGDSRTEEEVVAEYMYKDVPYRKNRYWLFSDSSWRGEKVDFYAPNLYRRIRSGYKYTDVLYGSEAEYWRHSALPTPHSGFGLVPLFTPNHWANKHRDSRPYPMTGGRKALRNIPVIGGVLDATVGAITNPPRLRRDFSKAHRAYLREINDNIKAEMSQQMQGAYAVFSPSGKIQLVGSDAELHAEAVPPAGVGDQTSYSVQNIPGARKAKADLTEINKTITAGHSAVGGPGMGRQALRDAVEMDLDSLATETSLGTQLSNVYYDTLRLMGLRGMAIREAVGTSPYDQRRIAHAGAIDNPYRTFRDERLGGLGGSPMRMYRRLFPSGESYDAYNPYRNTMPDWMPGCFVEGTKVFTSSGLVNIEDIEIGDKVMSHEGLFQLVQWVNVREYEGEFITLDIDGIPEKITATRDHPFLVLKTESCNRINSECVPLLNGHRICNKCNNVKHTKLAWVKANEIQAGDYVVEVFPRPGEELPLLPVPKIGGLDFLFRHYILLNYDAGLMCGLYAAQPSSKIDNELRLCYNYRDIVEDFCYFFDIEPIYTSNEIIIRDEHIIQWFKTHFRDNTLPSWIYDAPEDFRLAFVTAYIDSNSTFRKTRGSITIYNPPKGMYQLLGSVGIYARYQGSAIVLNIHETRELRKRNGGFGRLQKPIIKAKNKRHIPFMDGYVLRKVKHTESKTDKTLVYNLQVDIDATYNVYGIAVHNSTYFIDFQHGDPFRKIPFGEARLPGAGYETLNKLHPDQFFGQYGAVDRHKILGNVAPYSSEYKYYNKVVSMMNQSGLLSDEAKEVVKETREQVSEVKKPFDLHEYRFRDAKVKKETVTVKYVIDANTFVAEEYPLNPIKMAGLTIPEGDDSEAAEEARAFIENTVRRGSKVTIGVSEDPLDLTSGDSMNTIRAVIYDKKGVSIQSQLKRISKAKGADFKVKQNAQSPVDVAALYTPSEITVGKAWEFVSHLDTPFHTAFLQTRSGLEMYERREIYRKTNRSWVRPISDWIAPAYRGMMRHNPLISTALGAGLGALSGATVQGAQVGAIIGGAIAGIGSSISSFKEAFTPGNRRSVPKRIEKEREIEEYYDMLKYVKFKALYEKTADLAKKEEGIDVRELTDDKLTRRQKRMKKGLEKKRAVLKMRLTDPLVYEDRVQKELDWIDEQLSNRDVVRLGPLSLQALRYKEEYESTLYGLKDLDYEKIYKALPKRERAYFQSFASASARDRAKILRIIPQNQRRVFQRLWGLKPDKKVSLENYFQVYNLPDADWEGWQPDVSLDAIKIKTMQDAGIDLKHTPYRDEAPIARGVPRIKNIRKPLSMSFDSHRLQRVLEGAGLKNVKLRYSIGPANDADSIAISVDTHTDPMRQFTNYINNRGI